MKLTNPPIIRGLGRTASVNRRGLVTAEPTPKGLGQTATRAARDPGQTGQPLKITQLVVAYTTGAVSIASGYTLIQELSINRLGGSLLDINVHFEVSDFAGDTGAGAFYHCRTRIYRDATLLRQFFGRVPAINSNGVGAANQFYAGDFFITYVDDDYVSGVVDYSVEVNLLDVTTAAIDGFVEERYLRVLERKQ